MTGHSEAAKLEKEGKEAGDKHSGKTKVSNIGGHSDSHQQTSATTDVEMGDDADIDTEEEERIEEEERQDNFIRRASGRLLRAGFDLQSPRLQRMLSQAAEAGTFDALDPADRAAIEKYGEESGEDGHHSEQERDDEEIDEEEPPYTPPRHFSEHLLPDQFPSNDDEEEIRPHELVPWHYNLLGVEQIDSVIPPKEGIQTAFDRMMTVTHQPSGKTGPMSEGWIAPRNKWSSVEWLEEYAEKQEVWRANMGSAEIVPNAAAGVKAGPAARKKALQALGVAKKFDRTIETPVESDASGSNFSDGPNFNDEIASSSESEGDISETNHDNKNKGKNKEVVKMPARKSDGPKYVRDLFTNDATPKGTVGQPPKGRKEACLDARDEFMQKLNALADQFDVPLEVVIKDCELPFGGGSLREPTTWNLYLQNEKDTREPGETVQDFNKRKGEEFRSMTDGLSKEEMADMKNGLLASLREKPNDNNRHSADEIHMKKAREILNVAMNRASQLAPCVHPFIMCLTNSRDPRARSKVCCLTPSSILLGLIESGVLKPRNMLAEADEMLRGLPVIQRVGSLLTAGRSKDKVDDAVTKNGIVIAETSKSTKNGIITESDKSTKPAEVRQKVCRTFLKQMKFQAPDFPKTRTSMTYSRWGTTAITYKLRICGWDSAMFPQCPGMGFSPEGASKFDWTQMVAAQLSCDLFIVTWSSDEKAMLQDSAEYDAIALVVDLEGRKLMTVGDVTRVTTAVNNKTRCKSTNVKASHIVDKKPVVSMPSTRYRIVENTQRLNGHQFGYQFDNDEDLPEIELIRSPDLAEREGQQGQQYNTIAEDDSAALESQPDPNYMVVDQRDGDHDARNTRFSTVDRPSRVMSQHGLQDPSMFYNAGPSAAPSARALPRRILSAPAHHSHVQMVPPMQPRVLSAPVQRGHIQMVPMQQAGHAHTSSQVHVASQPVKNTRLANELDREKNVPVEYYKPVNQRRAPEQAKAGPGPRTMVVLEQRASSSAHPPVKYAWTVRGPPGK